VQTENKKVKEREYVKKERPLICNGCSKPLDVFYMEVPNCEHYLCKKCLLEFYLMDYHKGVLKECFCPCGEIFYPALIEEILE